MPQSFLPKIFSQCFNLVNDAHCNLEISNSDLSTDKFVGDVLGQQLNSQRIGTGY
jgi:hypothetical protein